MRTDRAAGASGVNPRGGELRIRRERSEDHRAVRALHTAAFEGDERVPALADALRSADAPPAAMSFVATAGGHVVGHVLLSAGRLDAPRRLGRPSAEVVAGLGSGHHPELQRM